MHFIGLFYKDYEPRSDCSLMSSLIRVHSVCFHSKAKKRKFIVSGYPTYPNILGPARIFFEDFWDILVYFDTVIKDFHTFPYKKICLHTNLKNLGHVTGNKAYFLCSVSFFVQYICRGIKTHYHLDKPSILVVLIHDFITFVGVPCLAEFSY